jgi:hypothetical protein
MANTPRNPLFVPVSRPSISVERLGYGSPATLISPKPPRFQPYQFWPEVRLRNWEERIAFDLGTSTALISVVFLPRFQPFQFWPEAKPPRNWEERIAFQLGSPGPLTYTNPKFQQTFVLNPSQEVRLPVVPHQPNDQGSPATLVYPNPKPQQIFTQRPEIKFPVVDQPTVQGSPQPLLRDKPVGEITLSLPEIRTPTRPTDRGQISLGSPATLTTVTSSAGAGSSSGTGTASGVGRGIDTAVGSASGNGVATGVGRGIDTAVGNAAGTGTVASASAVVKPAVGSASGTGAAAGVGQAIDGAIGSSSGTGTALGVGRATDTAIGNAAGTGTASGVGRATKQAVGNASGTGTATGVAAQFAGAGSASGTGTATGVGQYIRGAIGNASGTGTATGHIVDAGIVTQPPAPIVSGGISGPLRPRRKLPIEVVIEGILFTYHVIFIPGHVETISFSAGRVEAGAVVSQFASPRSIRFKFMDVGQPMCNDITDCDIEDVLSILGKILEEV